MSLLRRWYDLCLLQKLQSTEVPQLLVLAPLGSSVLKPNLLEVRRKCDPVEVNPFFFEENTHVFGEGSLKRIRVNTLPRCVFLMSPSCAQPHNSRQVMKDSKKISCFVLPEFWTPVAPCPCTDSRASGRRGSASSGRLSRGASPGPR